MKQGKLMVGCGPMGGGKTEWLIKNYHKGDLVVVPKMDSRSNGHLKNHDGLILKAGVRVNENRPEQIIKLAEDLDKDARVIIDEANFFDESLVRVVELLVGMGRQVWVAGLLLDSDLNDFGPTRILAKKANLVEHFYARCDFENGRPCKQLGVYNFFKGKKPGQAVVGAFDLYGVSCEKHINYFREKYTLDRLYYRGKPWQLRQIEPQKITRVLMQLGKSGTLRQNKNNSKWPRIEVAADSMRVGKTTAVEVLARGFKEKGWPVVTAFEDWQHNPFLKRSYQDPMQAIVASQKWFIRRKWEQVKTGARKAVFIQDVAPETDFNYAVTNALLGRMSKEGFEEYLEWFKQLNWHLTPRPNLLVYLKVSDAQLLERAKKSLRPFETVAADYLLTMKRVNRTWLKRVKKHVAVLEVDTDVLDFAHNVDAGQRLFRMIQRKLLWPKGS